MGDIIHHEDGGIVDISIRNDGKVAYECRRCHKQWLSKETPDNELSEQDLSIVREAMSRLKTLKARRTERRQLHNYP